MKFGKFPEVPAEEIESDIERGEWESVERDGEQQCFQKQLLCRKALGKDSQVPWHHVQRSLTKASNDSPLALHRDTGVPLLFFVLGVVNLQAGGRNYNATCTTGTTLHRAALCQ